MRLALLEMRRARARFGLLTGAVGLLLFLILFQQTLLGGLVTDFVGALRNQSADVLVYGDQARRNVQGSLVTPEQVAAVAKVPGVAAAAGIGQGTFTVDAGGELRDASLFGYELGGPGEPTTLTEGRLPRADGEAVASSADAGDGFDVGDRVRVEPGGYELRIVGLAREIRLSVGPTLFASYATFEAARLAANPDATGVAPSLVGVEVAEGEDAAAVAARIDGQVDGVEALTRARAQQEAPGVASVQQSFSLVLGLAYVVVTLVTGFFFLILTVQKSATLTLLRALGARRRTLVGALLVQVALVVAGGTVAGAVLLVLATRAASTGLSTTADWRGVAVTACVVLVLAALAATVSARRVLRIDPAAAATGQGRGVM